MVAGSAARIIRAPGRVIVNPTTSFETTAYPYGGIEVGKANQCMLTPQGTPFRVECEALGEASEILEPNKRYAWGCFLRGWDDDAVQRFFAGYYEVGSVTQHAVYAEPGGRVPGMSMIDRAIILAYVPDDPIHVPGVLIYRGISYWTTDAEIAYRRQDENGIPLTVDCLRDANDNMLKIGRLADLALT